jgi:hypothetical protein
LQVESKPEDAPAQDRKPEETVQVSSGKTSQILVNEEAASASDFHNNDTKVLEILNEAGSNYTFKGLMRKLNIHQQSLSRALHRLQELGLVERTGFGYKLGSASAGPEQRKPKGLAYMQLLQTYIPANVKSGEILLQLAGKWFKNLRWLGMIQSGTGYTLQWTSEDGSFQINLRLISDYVIIETNASTEKEKVQAMSGSYAIYEHITRAVQNTLANRYRLDYHSSANN